MSENDDGLLAFDRDVHSNVEKFMRSIVRDCPQLPVVHELSICLIQSSPTISGPRHVVLAVQLKADGKTGDVHLAAQMICDTMVSLSQHAQTKKPMNIRCADYRISAS